MANMSFISCATTCARRLLVSARKGLLAAPSATRDGASYPQYAFQAAAISGFTSRITQQLIGRATERAAAVGAMHSLSQGTCFAYLTRPRCPRKWTFPSADVMSAESEKRFRCATVCSRVFRKDREHRTVAHPIPLW